MPTIRVGDIQMFYQDVGEGDPLVLIMGFGGDHLAWALQMAELRAAASGDRVRQSRGRSDRRS